VIKVVLEKLTTSFPQYRPEKIYYQTSNDEASSHDFPAWQGLAQEKG